MSSPQSLQAPRGCPDLFPDEILKRQHIIEIFRKNSELYGFKEHETPIFEHSEVFLKSLGDDSDVVTKEMYNLVDKGGESFTLRPEATASVARLFVSHKLSRELPYKVFYQGPMFRHERPQKGRLRQFTQLGVENIGGKNPLIDAETIALAWRVISDLKLNEGSKILINSLGQSAERKEFRQHLVKYLTQKKSQLSEDSQKRLLTNPLRILDSKDEQDQKLLKGAPELKAFLTPDSLSYLEKVQSYLDHLSIPWQYEPRLVRGLDYYCDTVFEIQNSGLGAQATLLAGGRYDQLISSMGGPDTPSFGWAAGLERLLLVSDINTATKAPIGVIDMTHAYPEYLLSVCEALRTRNQQAYYSLTGNFSKQLKKCEKQGCQKVIIFGPDEVKEQSLQFKDLKTGTQQTLSLKDLNSLDNDLQFAQ